jgi:hypothetical protein
MRTKCDRLCKVLYGLEYVFDGMICDHWPIDLVSIRGRPRRWHPSYWLAFVRCVWLGDKCGSGMFKWYGKGGNNVQPE